MPMMSDPRNTAVQYAAAASQTVQLLNHASRTPEAFDTPADVDAALASVTELAQRLPQAIEQLARALEAQHAAGRIRHDRGGAASTLTAEVGVAGDLLREGASSVLLAAEMLGAAREVTSHFGGHS